MHYDHSTCMYYDQSAGMYYDDRKCMYYDHRTCTLFWDHSEIIHVQVIDGNHSYLAAVPLVLILCCVSMLPIIVRVYVT